MIKCIFSKKEAIAKIGAARVLLLHSLSFFFRYHQEEAESNSKNLCVYYLYLYVIKIISHPLQQTLSKTETLEKHGKNYNYLHLIKTPKMRKLTLLTGIVWWVSPQDKSHKVVTC